MSLTSGLDDLAVLSVTRQGVALARRLEAAVPARLTVYVTEKYADDAPSHYVRFEGKLQTVVDAAWARHERSCSSARRASPCGRSRRTSSTSASTPASS